MEYDVFHRGGGSGLIHCTVFPAQTKVNRWIGTNELFTVELRQSRRRLHDTARCWSIRRRRALALAVSLKGPLLACLLARSHAPSSALSRAACRLEGAVSRPRSFPPSLAQKTDRRGFSMPYLCPPEEC